MRERPRQIERAIEEALDVGRQQLPLRRIELGLVHRRLRARRQLAQLVGRDRPHLTVGRRARQPHQPIDQHAFFRAAHRRLVAIRRRRVPGRRGQAIDDVLEPRHPRIDGVLRHHPRGAIELQREADRHIGRDRRRAERIEGVAGGPRKELAVHAPARRPRRDQRQHRRRHRQLRRPQRHRQCVERLALIVDADAFGRRTVIAAHRVDVVLPRDHRRRRFDGVAVIHEDRHQRLFDQRGRHAGADGVLADLVERRAPHLHQPVQLVGLILAVRPLIDLRVRVGVLVGHVAQILRPRIVQHLRERRLLVRARRELAVAVVDRHPVPITDLLGIGLGDVDGAVRVQLLERMRIVHHRDPALLAVVVVVAETERVADLVRRELADALQRREVGRFRLLLAGDVGRRQPFEDQVVLAIAQRAERDGALEDLAGTRIRDRPAGAPAARRAVDPVDHVVADVHRVGAFRQHRNLEAVAETGGFERLVPPARAFDQRLLHVFRRARIHPVLNRLQRVADRGVRILLLQAMTPDVAHLHHVADRHAVVDEGEAAVAGARIVVPRRVVVVG